MAKSQSIAVESYEIGSTVHVVDRWLRAHEGKVYSRRVSEGPALTIVKYGVNEPDRPFKALRGDFVHGENVFDTRDEAAAYIAKRKAGGGEVETAPLADVRGFVITIWPDRTVSGVQLSSPADLRMALSDALEGTPRVVHGMDHVLVPGHLASLLPLEISAFVRKGRLDCVAFRREALREADPENLHAGALITESREFTEQVSRKTCGDSNEVRGPMAIVTGTNEFLALL